MAGGKLTQAATSLTGQDWREKYRCSISFYPKHHLFKFFTHPIETVTWITSMVSMSSFFRLLVCDSNTDVRDTLKELVLPLAGDLLPGTIQINKESLVVCHGPGENCCPSHALLPFLPS